MAFDIDDLVADAAEVFALLPRDVPRFVVAHSMGGLVATRLVLNHGVDVAGVVLSGPLLYPDPEKATPLLKAVSSYLAAALPMLPVVPSVVEEISGDPAVREAYANDPLVWHGSMPAKTGDSVLKRIDDTAARAAEFTKPILILHGALDTLCLPQGSKDFIARISSGDKRLEMIDGVLHEILWEESVRKRVVEWISEHITN